MAQLVKPIHWLTTDDRLLHGCAGKEQYDSFAAADMIRKRRSKKGVQVKAYKCTNCRLWHLGRDGRDIG